MWWGVNKFSLIFLLGASLAPADLLAENMYAVGVVGAMNTEPYYGVEDSSQALPYLAIGNDYFSISITDGFSVGILEAESSSGYYANVEGVVNLRSAPGYVGVNNPLYKGLDRKDGLDAGFKGRFGWQIFFTEFDWMHDVSNSSEGAEAHASIGAQYMFSGIGVEAQIGMALRDGSLNNYLYGVGASEATAARSQYVMGETTSYFGNLMALYEFNDKLMMLGGATYEELPIEAINSPLVEDDVVSSIFLGLIYQF